MNQRLIDFIEHTGMNKSEFATEFGATKQEVSNWCGGTRMSIRRISDMLGQFPMLNGHWFLTGDGEMLNYSGQSVTKKEKSFKNDSEEIEFLKGKITELEEMIIQLQGEKIVWLEGKQ